MTTLSIIGSLTTCICLSLMMASDDFFDCKPHIRFIFIHIFGFLYFVAASIIILSVLEMLHDK